MYAFQTQTQGRGRLILNIETAVILRGILDTYIAELDTLTSTSTEGSDSERLRRYNDECFCFHYIHVHVHVYMYTCSYTVHVQCLTLLVYCTL